MTKIEELETRIKILEERIEKLEHFLIKKMAFDNVNLDAIEEGFDKISLNIEKIWDVVGYIQEGDPVDIQRIQNDMLNNLILGSLKIVRNEEEE